ncbi:hypothetical protein IAF33_19430, partial [Acinetobacter baumannii]|nr:hypothetical protein [Acinetobacter baumannii]
SRFNLRAQVVQTLLKVQQGQSLASILNTQLNQVAERDRALFHGKFLVEPPMLLQQIRGCQQK